MKTMIKILPQRGRSDSYRDRRLKALPPGKRISEMGNVYWETRKNRSDKVKKKV